MNEQIYDVIQGNCEIVDRIKIVIYKQYPHLFELLDFHNNEIFEEPLIYAYYHVRDSKVSLEQILYGYIDDEKKPKSISVWCDEDGMIYLPKIGWFKTSESNTPLTLVLNENTRQFVLNKEGVVIQHTYEPLKFVDHTSFEIVMHQHPLLKVHYFDSKNRPVDVEIDNVTLKNIVFINEAVRLIRKNTPIFFELLHIAIKKVVVFNDESVRRNSFAAQSVHGCAFFNAFQKNYNEVFFIEDIAHQCGHVIFNAIVFDKSAIFKASPETNIRSNGLLGWIMNSIEGRTLFTLFHALYTYYVISICLDSCLENNVFTGHKRHEALGRLASTLIKFKMDLRLVSKKDGNGTNLYLTDQGAYMGNVFLDKYIEMERKWGSSIKHFRLFNQPYNFSYSHFLKLNPIPEHEMA